MSFALLAKFMPFVSMFDRLAGDLNSDDLAQVAEALAGPGSDDFAAILQVLAEKEPTTQVCDILASPTAKELFSRMRKEVRNGKRA